MSVLSHEKGFTLVELAIVMMIIAFLLGGVFKAMQMIENARVKQIGKDLIDFKISYYSYLDRLGKYPGNGVDITHVIDMDVVNVVDGDFFQDLFDEGFIGSPNPNYDYVQPGHYFVTNLPSTGTVSLTGGTILGKNQACVTLIESDYAKHLDNDLDDGVWNTGDVRVEADFSTADSHTLCLEF